MSSANVVHKFLKLVRTVFSFIRSLDYYMCMHDTWRPEIAAIFQLVSDSDLSAGWPLGMICSHPPPITLADGHKQGNIFFCPMSSGNNM